MGRCRVGIRKAVGAAGGYTQRQYHAQTAEKLSCGRRGLCATE